MKVTDAMVDRAHEVLAGEWATPYMARARDYVTPGSTGAEREAELAALRAADEEAERRSRDLIRRALAAALEAER